MIPAQFNFQAWSDSVWMMGVETDVDGVAIDWSGFSPRMEVRKSCSTDPVLTFSESDGTVIQLDLSNGSFVLVQPADKMLDALVGVYEYDLAMVSGNDTTRILYGEFSIRRSITPQNGVVKRGLSFMGRTIRKWTRS